MLLCLRKYPADPLSLRYLEEVMAERGISGDHATVHRWALKILPVLAKVRHYEDQQHQRSVTAFKRHACRPRPTPCTA